MDPALFVLARLAPAVTQIMCSGVGQLRSRAQPLRGFSWHGLQTLSCPVGATSGVAFCEAGTQAVMREQVGWPLG